MFFVWRLLKLNMVSAKCYVCRRFLKQNIYIKRVTRIFIEYIYNLGKERRFN